MDNDKKNTPDQEVFYEGIIAENERAVKHAKFIKETNDMIMDAIFGKGK